MAGRVIKAAFNDGSGRDEVLIRCSFISPFLLIATVNLFDGYGPTVEADFAIPRMLRDGISLFVCILQTARKWLILGNRL